MPYVDTKEYISMLKGLTEEGHLVSLLVSGWSMTPFLAHERDTVYFKKPDRPLKIGDIVFYERDNGQYVLHRIVRAHRQETFDMAGDAQVFIERGIRRAQIFGLVVRVTRKGRELTPASPMWLFYSVVWVCVLPARHALMKIRNFFRHFQPRNS